MSDELWHTGCTYDEREGFSLHTTFLLTVVTQGS